MRRRIIRRASAVALLALLIGVPGSSAAASQQAHIAGHAGYVGTVSGTRAFVAVVERGSRVTASKVPVSDPKEPPKCACVVIAIIAVLIG